MKEVRKRIWVDPFQSKIFLRVVGYCLLYQVTVWNFLFAWRLLEEGRGDLWAQYQSFCLSNYPMLLCLLVLVPLLAYDAVQFSHGLVGPLQRFRRVMREVAAGQTVQPVQLRPGDQLTELQDDFNAMLEALSRRGALTLTEAKGTNDHAQEAAANTLPPAISEKA